MIPIEIKKLIAEIAAYYDKPYTEPQMIRWEESLASMKNALVLAAWKRYTETNTTDRRPTLGNIMAICDEIRDSDSKFGQSAEKKREEPAAPVTVLLAWEKFDFEYRLWCMANASGGSVFRELFAKVAAWVRQLIDDTETMNDNEGGWLAVYAKIMAVLPKRRAELEKAGQWPRCAVNELHISEEMAR